MLFYDDKLSYLLSLTLRLSCDSQASLFFQALLKLFYIHKMGTLLLYFQSLFSDTYQGLLACLFSSTHKICSCLLEMQNMLFLQIFRFCLSFYMPPLFFCCLRLQQAPNIFF